MVTRIHTGVRRYSGKNYLLLLNFRRGLRKRCFFRCPFPNLLNHISYVHSRELTQPTPRTRLQTGRLRNLYSGYRLSNLCVLLYLCLINILLQLISSLNYGEL